MRILIDCRCLQTSSPRGGVAVYAEQLTRALLAASSSQPQVPTLRSGPRYGVVGASSRIEWTLFANGIVDPRRNLPQFDVPNVHWMVHRWPNKIFDAACGLQLAASRFDADVVFLPNLNFLPPLPPRTKLVVTVHDLSFEHFPDCFTLKQRLWHRMIRPRKLLERADAIVAVSETTKRDVMETYGIPDSCIHVVYPGVEHSNATNAGFECFEYSKYSDEIRSMRMFPEPFLLSLSELSPRKNLDGLIAAFGQLQATSYKLQALHLIIAGNHGSAERALRRQIARSPIRERIHLLGPITENEKHALLARASCFVYPSLWEGFGFPPLEAMSAGVPVVASTGGSLPEVLGDAALLVDPLDPAAIAEAIARVLTDDALRTDLIARGHARAARFRWDAAARQLHDVLTSVIRGNP